MRAMRWMTTLGLAGAVGIGVMHELPARADDDDAPKAIAIGSAVPLKTVVMKSVDGKKLTLATAAGKKGTLVLFICNHCPWVKAWQTRIAAIGNGARERGFGVVAINSNDPAAFPEDAFDVMKKRAKEVGYRFPYVMDETSDVARAFGASHTPEVFLFDATGKLVYHGAIDDNAHEEQAVEHRWLEEAVTALQNGKAVPVAETKALGCGIHGRVKRTS